VVGRQGEYVAFEMPSRLVMRGSAFPAKDLGFRVS